MNIILRSDGNNLLGFVERYRHYFYEHRTVSVLGLANVGGYFSEPFVFRGDEFIPATKIDEEMGIEKYLRAKKPFYSVIGTGNVVVKAKIAMTLDAKVYLPEKSVYDLYFIDKDSLTLIKDGEWSANLRKISSVSGQLSEWFHQLGTEFVKCGNDRGLFIKSRFDK